jgi:Domain of unknown function (DUF5071)
VDQRIGVRQTGASAVGEGQRDRLRWKELRKLLPTDKDDVAAVEALAKSGYAAVQPVLYDLLKWIRVDSWPVAKPVCDFLVTIGPALAPEVGRVLASRDDLWKAAVLRHIVDDGPADAIRELSPQLFMIATDGQSWGADLLALRLLARHRIGESQWIAGWLEFKRSHHHARLADIADIVALIEARAAA